MTSTSKDCMVDATELRRFSYLRTCASHSGERQVAPADMPPDLLADRTFVRWLVTRFENALTDVAPALRDDPEIVIRAGRLKGASERLRDDVDVVRQVVAKNPYDYRDASPRVRENVELALAVIAAYSTEAVSPALLGDREFALRAVSLNASALASLPEALRDDDEIVRAAALGRTNSNDTLRHASERLRADRSLVRFDRITKGGYVESYGNPAWLPEALRGDRAIAIRAIARSEDTYEVLPEHLRADREVRFARLARDSDEGTRKKFAAEIGERAAEVVATAESSFDWRSVPAEWWDDPAFARAACWRSDSAVPLVSVALRSDPEFVHSLAAALNVKLPAGCLPEATATDREVARVCVQHRPESLAAFPKLASDYGFVSSLVADGFDVLEHVPAELQSDRALALVALRFHPRAFQHLSEGMRGDRDLALLAVSRDGLQLKHAAGSLRADRAVVLAAVRSRGTALQYGDASLRADPEVVEEAILRDDRAFDYVAAGLKDDLRVRHLIVAAHRSLSHAGPLAADPEIVLDCLANNYGRGFEHAAEALRTDLAFLKRVKKVSLEPFRHVAPALRDAVLAIDVETPSYRGRKVCFRISPQSSLDAREQNIIHDVRVLAGDEVLVSAASLPWLEYDSHGPVGSYCDYSAANGFALLGDFVFFHSVRGLDGPRTVEHGWSFSGKWTEENPQVSDRAHELWLVDMPTRGVSVTLTREEALDDATGLHLLAKVSRRSHVLALSVAQGNLEATYRALSEFAGGDAKALRAYAELGEDHVVRFKPPTGAYVMQSRLNEEIPLVQSMLKSGCLWEWVESKPGAPPPGPRAIACGGAACVWIEGFGVRWLFPRSDGTYTWEAQKARLAATGPRDDWETLRRHWIGEASADEREGVRDHFANVGDPALAAEVAAALAG